MTINEPLTLATDYMLTIASVIFGVLLWRRGVRLWALAFFFTACGTFLFRSRGPRMRLNTTCAAPAASSRRLRWSGFWRR